MPLCCCPTLTPTVPAAIALLLTPACLPSPLYPPLPPPFPADGEDAGASVYRLVRSAGGAGAAVRLRIHHSSVLFRCRPQWVCFYSAEQNDTGW